MNMIAPLLPVGSPPPSFHDRGPNTDVWGCGLYSNGSHVWAMVYYGKSARFLAGRLANTIIKKAAEVNWVYRGCRGPVPAKLTENAISQQQSKLTTAYAAGLTDADGCWSWNHIGKLDGPGRIRPYITRLRLTISQKSSPALMRLVIQWARGHHIDMTLSTGAVHCSRAGAVKAFLELVVMGGFMLRKGFKGWAIYEAWFKGENGVVVSLEQYPSGYKPSSDIHLQGVDSHPMALVAYTWVVGISGDCTCCAGRIYIKWSLVMPHIHKVVTCTSDILNVVTWHQRYTRCARLTTTEQACGRLILGLLLLSCYRLMPKRYRCC